MRSYVNDVNFWGDTNAEELAKLYGTPIYVYNENILRQSMRTVKNIIKKYPYTANYSIKANSNLWILKMALEEGLNCDAMSEGEIRMLQLAGFPSERIFFVSNNISESEMKFAIDNNIMISLDSISQVEMFGQLNPGGRCSVRLNPGVGAGHHEKVVTAGKNTKFAISDADLDELDSVIAKYDLKLVGVNQHVGSLFMDPEPFLAAVSNLLNMVKRYKNLEFIDFGGGYGIPYHKVSEGEKPFDYETFSAKFEKLLDDFVADYGYAPLFKTEPGRCVCAESCVLLGRVHSIKQNAGRKYAGTDIGMNVLVRPSMYGSWHDIEIIRDGKVVFDDPEQVTVVGNICESGDILAKDRLLPRIEKDDLVCVLDSGAYGYSMCSNYNTRFRPAEVLIKSDGKYELIRRRDNFEDLIRNQFY